MKILLAPSETKAEGGTGAAINQESFLFPELYAKRREMADLYRDIVAKGDTQALAKLFGVTKPAIIEHYRFDIADAPTMKAVERYTGVAFDFLGYDTLNSKAQAYVDSNVIIISNLFGPLLASDALPEYKLKQGVKLGEVAVEKHYKEHFTAAMESWLEGESIIDLRAGIYEKYYPLRLAHIRFSFLKEGKTVSHWAKAYRGRLLRVLAQHNIQSIEQIEAILPEDMQLLEKVEKKNAQTEWVVAVTGVTDNGQ